MPAAGEKTSPSLTHVIKSQARPFCQDKRQHVWPQKSQRLRQPGRPDPAQYMPWEKETRTNKAKTAESAGKISPCLLHVTSGTPFLQERDCLLQPGRFHQVTSTTKKRMSDPSTPLATSSTTWRRLQSRRAQPLQPRPGDAPPTSLL